MTNAELITALRCCIVDFNSTQSRRCNECPYRIYADGKKACENKAKRDAADALEAAEKRIAELMPKEGEWKVQTTVYPSITCSECGVEIPLVAGWRMDAHTNYCPNCGSRMRKGEQE